MADELKVSNETKNITSQCKIVVYPWTQEGLSFTSSDRDLSGTSPIDVSSQLMTCSFTKNIADPSGQFSFTLSNSPNYGSGDWKDIIKRGTWCVIYMSQDGDLAITPQVGPPDSGAQKSAEAKKIRCIGYIDRVSVSSEINENGAFDVVYEISGRDFGVVYEDTTIWHNVFQFDQIILDSVATSGLRVTGSVTINEAIDIIHDLFYNPKNLPGAKVNDNKSLTSVALQWLMPTQLLRDIGFRNISTSFWGEIPGIKNIQTTKAGIHIEQPTDFLSGNAWDQLKTISVPQFHELFTETTDDGKPRITFRPIPFAIDKSKYKFIGQDVTYYKDISEIVQISAIDVLNFNLGEDNYERYNSFLVTVSTGLINTEDNVSLLRGSDYPKNITDSIKRHGFRAMHITADSIIKNTEQGDGAAHPQRLIEFNELLYDYWNNAIFAESGTVELIGNNSVKIGKVLKFTKDVPYVYGKRYYIESYTDVFTVDEKGAGTWTQEVALTRGFEEKDLQNKSGFGTRNEAFNHEGEFTNSGMQSVKRNKK